MRLRTPDFGVVPAVAIVASCVLAATACSSSAKSATAAAPTTSPATGASAAPTGAGTHLAAATCNRPHHAGQSSHSFTYKGKKRTYLLYVPTSYQGTTKVPMVFNFHGYGSNASEQMLLANFGPIADKNDFLVVAPNGQDGGGRHWSFTESGGFQSDVAMVDALIKHLEGSLCVDATRIYSTGMSDGGAMTSVLACTSSNTFAAFAAVAVVVYCGVPQRRAVAIESYAGSKDPIVPTNGGQVTCCGNPTLPSKASAMANWATHDACKATYTDTRIKPHVVRRTWTGCKPGSTSVYYLVEGDGHTWPGGPSLGSLGHATKEISASALIWKFFAAHKLPT
jgi:polyhydroxybutyrate depolymerase